MSQIMMVHIEQNAWTMEALHECKVFLRSTIKLIAANATHAAADLQM
jgi:hypothetical protein